MEYIPFNIFSHEEMGLGLELIKKKLLYHFKEVTFKLKCDREHFIESLINNRLKQFSLQLLINNNYLFASKSIQILSTPNKTLLKTGQTD